MRVVPRVLVIVTLMFITFLEVPASSSATSHSPVFSYPFEPVIYGTHVWVANERSSITELNKSNGSLARIVDTNTSDVIEAIALSNSHLWVASEIRQATAPSLSLIRRVED